MGIGGMNVPVGRRAKERMETKDGEKEKAEKDRERSRAKVRERQAKEKGDSTNSVDKEIGIVGDRRGGMPRGRIMADSMLFPSKLQHKGS